MDDGVLVTNIKSTVDDCAFRTFFEKFGTITDLNMRPDKFNEDTKICYMRYSTVDSAAKSVRQADKTTHFGEPLKISFKKYAERAPKEEPKTNGIIRTQSFGRGRGALSPTPAVAGSLSENVQLKDLELPLEKKCLVEVVELKSLVNILVRPLLLTESYRSNLCAALEQINQNTDKLYTANNPEVDGFYLAKWTEDNKFYRAKILNKLSDAKFEVCFVDEGTSGDIVTELKVIPDSLVKFPCQFLTCSLDCTDSPELVELVLIEGANSEVSVYATTSTKVNNRYLVNIFVGDKDIISLYKEKHKNDPRIEKVPTKQNIKAYTLGTKYTDCTISKHPNKINRLIVVMKDSVHINPKQPQPLMTCPQRQDLLVYKESNGNLHRCVVKSLKFDQGRVGYSINLVDEGRCVEATASNLTRVGVADVNFPPKVIRGVSDAASTDATLLEAPQTIELVAYDGHKNLYVLNIVKKCKTTSFVGQTKAAVLSHVESATEFYVQFTRDASLLDKVQAEINNPEYKMIRMNDAGDLRLNQMVVAPFQEVNYRAVVREIDTVKNSALLKFLDFGNSEWTIVSQLIKADNNVTHHEAMSRQCRLAVPVGAKNDVEALLLDYCDQMEAPLAVKVLSEDGDVMVVDLTAKNKSPFVDILEFKSLAAVKEKTTVAEICVKKESADGPISKTILRDRVADMEVRIIRIEKMLNKR